MGIAAGIVALVVIAALFVGLVLNHRRLTVLKGRRDELDQRVAGVEVRLAQLAELERRQNLARRRAPQQQPPRSVAAPIAAPVAVQRVPPPPIPIRPSAPG